MSWLGWAGLVYDATDICVTSPRQLSCITMILGTLRGTTNGLFTFDDHSKQAVPVGLLRGRPVSSHKYKDDSIYSYTLTDRNSQYASTKAAGLLLT